ncbi:MAG: hypothetical protein H0V82_06460 [Candidatus Protochlamydia sp.]|nr:hypothetical protein [Candidatus Protochlamydia sp.]
MTHEDSSAPHHIQNKAQKAVERNTQIFSKRSDGLSKQQGLIDKRKMRHNFSSKKGQLTTEIFDQMVLSVLKIILKNFEMASRRATAVDLDTEATQYSQVNQLVKAFNKFKENFMRNLIASIEHNFFPAYAQNIKYLSLLRKYGIEEINHFYQEYIREGKSLEKIEKKLEQLLQNKRENREEIIRIEELSTLITFQSTIKNGEATRNNLIALGAEPLSLRTPDGAILDGYYIDTSKFRQKLKDAGGELITFTDLNGIKIKGIAFDFSEWKEKKETTQLLKMIENLNLTDDLSDWRLVKYAPRKEELKIIIMPIVNSEIEKEINPAQQIPGENAFEIDINKIMTSPILKPIDVASKGGTVILSPGKETIYEKCMNEAFNYLFQGMNVTLFNYRGSGQSKGVPNDQKYHIDIETIYLFTKKRTREGDTRILFKSLSFRDEASAYAAGKHPHTNTIFEQTHSSFHYTVKERIYQLLENEINGVHRLSPAMKLEFYAKAKEWVILNTQQIIEQCYPLLFPNVDMLKNLIKNMGHKGIVYIHDDAEISIKDFEEKISMLNIDYLKIFDPSKIIEQKKVKETSECNSNELFFDRNKIKKAIMHTRLLAKLYLINLLKKCDLLDPLI